MYQEWIGNASIVDVDYIAIKAPKKIWEQFVRLRSQTYGTCTDKKLFAVCFDGGMDSVHDALPDARKRAGAL